jgi:hypothetical protein
MKRAALDSPQQNDPAKVMATVNELCWHRWQRLGRTVTWLTGLAEHAGQGEAVLRLLTIKQDLNAELYDLLDRRAA